MTAAVLAEPGRAEALADRTMVGRNGRPDDFAGMAVFLASDSSGYVAGQTLCVDGGFSVHRALLNMRTPRPNVAPRPRAGVGW
jgi:NAD(P)-dependent dehydrogenase (short-subunit alcohol dehydrogenase family)